jgi:cytochrome c553
MMYDSVVTMGLLRAVAGFAISTTVAAELATGGEFPFPSDDSSHKVAKVAVCSVCHGRKFIHLEIYHRLPATVALPVVAS